MSIYQNFLVILLCQTLWYYVTFVVIKSVARSIYVAISVDSCQYFQDLLRKECFGSKEHLVKLLGGPTSQHPCRPCPSPQNTGMVTVGLILFKLEVCLLLPISILEA